MNYTDFFKLAGQIVGIVLAIGLIYIVLQEVWMRLAGFIASWTGRMPHRELEAVYSEPVKRGPGRPRKQ